MMKNTAFSSKALLYNVAESKHTHLGGSRSPNNLYIAEYYNWNNDRLPIKIVNRILSAFGTKYRLVNSSKGGGSSFEHRINLFHLLRSVLSSRVPGDVVELGSQKGHCAAVMQTILREYHSQKHLHVFDSFQGFPQPSQEDGSIYRAGQLFSDQDTLIRNFITVGLKPPIIHPGWFKDTLKGGLPHSICFVHLDADLYESTLYCLEEVYPRLSKGAICFIGICCDSSIFDNRDTPMYYKSPGVKKACDAYLADKVEDLYILYAGTYTNAFFRKI